MNIKAVQTKLNSLGLGPLEVDGELGPKTKTAINTFQLAHDLTVGDATQETLNALFPVMVPNSLELNVRAMQIALTQEGIKEATGKNDGPAVESYLKLCGLGKGYSWCMAAVVWCYYNAAQQLGKKMPLLLTAGVMDQWNRTTCSRILKPKAEALRPGDIFILDHGDGTGHTGLIVAPVGLTANTIEGNTNTNGSANGDGWYQRNRQVSSFKGIIRP